MFVSLPSLPLIVPTTIERIPSSQLDHQNLSVSASQSSGHKMYSKISRVHSDEGVLFNYAVSLGELDIVEESDGRNG